MEEEMVNPARQSSKYKGVMQKPNGNWGAQIYDHNQRIWLGTFQSELEAALAYDSASLKLRWGGAHRNLPWTSKTTEEVKFQSLHSAEEVLKMIREGSYLSKFLGHARSCHPGHGVEVVMWRELFHKELTSSDVGALNRFVIPKRHATKYFPDIHGRGGSVELVFRDGAMRVWKFRYCYWDSSGSYVLTKGWKKFVREEGLKEKDAVAFLECDCRIKGKEEVQRICIIHVKRARTSGPSDGKSSTIVEGEDAMGVDLDLRLGHNTNDGEEKVMEAKPVHHADTVADFKLFGKQIFCSDQLNFA
ncbi:hypothetical protein SLEP1_g13016 [Rubroshorea leprosula]|uniref:Uncharacterized protein n=1 Tax=Rubroshorea leprosula TaxID=152421 RepID=A0AAV5IEF2_9ROSI|nr:hypothetical protein SLEP1_g13016 [Rubroshorea leprosula]